MDLIKKNLVNVVNCLTKKMAVNFFTKPPQENFFKLHLNTILGITM